MARGWVVQRLPDVRRRLRSVIEAVPEAVRYLDAVGRKICALKRRQSWEPGRVRMLILWTISHVGQNASSDQWWKQTQ